MPRRRRPEGPPEGQPLVLFFTRGVSLRVWDERGILDREAALYRELMDRGRPVSFVTYGDRSELGYADRLGGIGVLANGHRLNVRLYGQVAPFLHGRSIARAGVLKTNQVYGGLTALRAARLYRLPLVARCGFLWSEVADADDGPRSLRARYVARQERRLLRGADLVVVTTRRLSERIRERHGISPDRIEVIPNYVDTRRFAPTAEPGEPGALISVGRLSPEKNLGAAIEALAGLDGASLTIVGDGPEGTRLERRAQELGVDVRFAGRLPHERLPEVLGRASALLLPSLYEGHPKAAIEAMACGLPVIGADVPGIRELVTDGETGILCGGTPAELRAGIERAIGDPALLARMGEAARVSVEPLSLERTVEHEERVLERAARIRAGA